MRLREWHLWTLWALGTLAVSVALGVPLGLLLRHLQERGIL